MHPKHLSLPDRMVLRCNYRMTPFSVQERKSPAPSRREKELSKGVKTFEDAEKRGDVSIESHGIKGRLIVSRVRKMLFR